MSKYSLTKQVIVACPDSTPSEYVDEEDEIIDYPYIFKWYLISQLLSQIAF